MDGFLQWFNDNKVDVIRDTMLHSVRQECGLGNSPDIFTTNQSANVREESKGIITETE